MTRAAVVHADESCLGNGRDGQSPGGGGVLIEIAAHGGIVRRDLYIAEPDTTNNRMALKGAIAVLQLLAQKGQRLPVAYVSDSQYLIKGMREWMPSWRARGWRRKGGAIENLALWKSLAAAAEGHDVTWMWVRGHAGHPKNEYADALAVGAAERQEQSGGPVESGFDAWLEGQRARGRFVDYDPDETFVEVASQTPAAR